MQRFMHANLLVFDEQHWSHLLIKAKQNRVLFLKGSTLQSTFDAELTEFRRVAYPDTSSNSASLQLANSLFPPSSQLQQSAKLRLQVLGLYSHHRVKLQKDKVSSQVERRKVRISRLSCEMYWAGITVRSPSQNPPNVWVGNIEIS